MSAPTPAATEKKPKSKKLIVIGAIVAVLLAAAGGGAWFFLKKGHADEDEDGGAAHKPKATATKPAPAPTFFPMENLVVNLADPGGERFAQIGITLEVDDAKTADLLKSHLPTIRNGILMQASQRTAQELLTPQGKERLAQDILREAARPLGYKAPKKKTAGEDDDEAPAPKAAPSPVRRVLFSSFIIQ